MTPFFKNLVNWVKGKVRTGGGQVYAGKILEEMVKVHAVQEDELSVGLPSASDLSTYSSYEYPTRSQAPRPCPSQCLTQTYQPCHLCTYDRYNGICTKRERPCSACTHCASHTGSMEEVGIVEIYNYRGDQILWVSDDFYEEGNQEERQMESEPLLSPFTLAESIGELEAMSEESL